MKALMHILTISPEKFEPDTIALGRETKFIIIPIINTIVDIVHAHPLPFNNPKAMTRYATPTAIAIAPNTTKAKRIPTRGPIATVPIPTNRVRMPAITINIAIIVTPRGLVRFCICNTHVY